MGSDADAQPLDAVSQDLYWLLQAIEASRGIVNLFLRSLTESSLVSPAPTVDRLTVASPLDAWLRISVEVYLLLDKVPEKVRSLGSDVGDVVGGITRVPLVRAQAQLVEAQADFLRAQTEGIRIDNQRKEYGVQVLAEVRAVLIERLQADGVEFDLNGNVNAERLAQLFFNDLEPGAKQLAERGLVAQEDEPTSDRLFE